MKNLEILKKAQVVPETQEIFDDLKKAAGMVPNVYVVAANSHSGF